TLLERVGLLIRLPLEREEKLSIQLVSKLLRSVFIADLTSAEFQRVLSRFVDAVQVLLGHRFPAHRSLIADDSLRDRHVDRLGAFRGIDLAGSLENHLTVPV